MLPRPSPLLAPLTSPAISVNSNVVYIVLSGSNNLLKTIHEIYGASISKEMLPINNSNDDFVISGYICKPSVLKSNRNHMTTFVNNRLVKNYDIYKAINDGYYTYKPDIKYPVVILKIETDPTLVDVNIHPTKQDIKMGKMNELSDASNSIISDIDEYNNYISSLKTDAEHAYEVVYTFYDKVKTAEELVREINVKKTSEKYDPKFEQLYVLLNQINELLVHNPIDIDQINKLLRDLFEISNELLDDGEVSQDHNMAILAENAIMYANRHRHHLSDIDALLNQAETYFQNGDFENAYVVSGNVLKKIKQENGR